MHLHDPEWPRTIAEALRALDEGEVTAVQLVERAAAGIAAGDGVLRVTGDTGAVVEYPYDQGFIGLR